VRSKTKKSISRLAGIWTFVLLLIFKGIFPKPAYAFLTTVTEVKEKNENYQPFQKVPMTVDHSSPEYQAVVGELENNNVGGVPPKGQNDRSIVAETFFAESEEGVTPNFATQDTKVYNNLAKMAGIDPARTKQGILQAYPNGFEVTANGKTIHVIPLPKK